MVNVLVKVVVGNGIVYIHSHAIYSLFNSSFIHAYITHNYSLFKCILLLLIHSFLCRRDLRCKVFFLEVIRCKGLKGSYGLSNLKPTKQTNLLHIA